MSTMIEKVARALARHDNPKHENWWPSYESRARTSIEAVRLELLAMGQKPPSPYFWPDHAGDTLRVIDAALKEQP